jgi:hypothetical protein
MKNKFQFCMSLVLAATLFTTASAQTDKEGFQQAYLGVGFGLDYGGLGIKAELLPSKYISIFGGAGYNLAELGYNAGVFIRPLPGNKIVPVVTAMYGYNGVIKIQNRPDLSKVYYGLTVGAGCEIHTVKEHKWSLLLLVPFRNQAFHDYYQQLKDTGYEFKPGPIPIAFSVGYNFALRDNKTANK